MGRLAAVLLVLAVGAAVALGSPVSMLAAMWMGQQITAQQNAERSDSCAPNIGIPSSSTLVSVASLSADQTGAAHTIWQVAHKLSMGDRAAIVGIATAMQESNLGTNTSATNAGKDVGPFQQRSLPGWYGPHRTQAENTAWLSNTENAAQVFFQGRDENGIPGLDDIDGWEQMPVTEAAQKVQRSAYPTAYARHEQTARTLTQRFTAEAAGQPAPAVAGLCDPPGAVGPLLDCPPTGLGVERGLTPDGLRVLRCARQSWPQLSYGGVRPDSIPDHPSGRAIDIMTPGRCSPVGKQIADWARSNASALGVEYVIWCQEIWTVQRDGEGWRRMADRGSPTQNHMDHVHITVYGNRAGTAPAVGPGGGAAVSPVPGARLTSRYGQPGSAWRSGYHTGLDFAAPAGTPILAARGGVVLATTSGGPYGNLTKLSHGGTVETWYAHQQTVTVKPGQQVRAGQQIGTVGWSGNVRPAGPKGAHLHMEARRGGTPIDPHAWLASEGVRLY